MANRKKRKGVPPILMMEEAISIAEQIYKIFSNIADKNIDWNKSARHEFRPARL